jgi:hypothetical protein
MQAPSSKAAENSLKDISLLRLRVRWYRNAGPLAAIFPRE